jgi:hypothetical protein
MRHRVAQVIYGHLKLYALFMITHDNDFVTTGDRVHDDGEA